MKVKRISFFNNFKCLADKCPDTCCKGWIIPLDDDTVTLYHSQRGLLLLKLLITEGKRDGIVCFNKNSGTCPHFTKDHLCGLQKRYGEEFLCDTCREYPRYLANFEYFAKECLDLSCPAVADLFIKNLDNLDYIESDENIRYEKTVTNDDSVYLTGLCKSEDFICKHINNQTLNFDLIFYDLIKYAKAMQNEYLKDPNTNILNSEYTFDSCDMLNINATITDKLMHSRFYHYKISKTDPELYKFCKLYNRKFRNITVNEADELITNCIEVIRPIYANIDQFLRSYCIYYLRCTYLGIYEDYSFIKHIAMAFVHTHMIKLFIYLYVDKYSKLEDTDLIKIITAYDKRARHNTQIANEMYDEIVTILGFEKIT